MGPLPGSLQANTLYSAAIPAGGKNAAAAKALVNFFRSPEAAKVIKAKGMEPTMPGSATITQTPLRRGLFFVERLLGQLNDCFALRIQPAGQEGWTAGVTFQSRREYIGLR